MYPGVAAPMPNAVTYRFENGWVDTGDLPCRAALRREVEDRVISLPELSYPEVYLGGPSGDVDLSGFCHVPEWRVRHARVRLLCPKAQVIQARVKTAGAVHIWCGNALVARFEPFTRNQPQVHAFEFPAVAGAPYLTVRFEDLHERDTVFGFRLELVAGEGLQTEIEVDADKAEVATALAVLDGLRTVEVFNMRHQVGITSDALPDRDIAIRFPDLQAQEDALSADNPVFELTAPAGCSVQRCAVDLGGTQLVRHLGMTVLQDRVALSDESYEARKSALLARQDSGEDIVQALLALAQGRWDAAAQQILDQALREVEARHDCADFRMMSLLWIWKHHRQQLPDAQAERLTQAILGFRYWMDEPGNDVMWFWSENHVLCFHIAQFLAGEMMPAELFTASSRPGAVQARLGAARLHMWFDAIDEHGLAEWNSTAYYPINYRGLLALFTLAQDSALKQRAKLLLDRMSQMVALHMAGGVAAGSQGRLYEKELLAGPMTELGALGSLMFGGWHVPGKDAAAVMLALSPYRPPDAASGLARPEPGARIEAEYQQGLEGQARLNLFKTASVQLSSVVHHNPGQTGHQQHVIDLQFASDPLARIWVNHPGTLRHWAEARPSFWAGNGRLPDVTQGANTALMLYELRPGDIPFTHLFLPQDHFDECLSDAHWVFVRAGQGYGAIWSAGALEPEQDGLYAGYERRQAGPMSAWVIHAGDAALHGSFAAFIETARALAPQLAGPRLTAGSAVLDASDRASSLPALPVTPNIKITRNEPLNGRKNRDASYER
ncbi:hypothetical protein AIOL_001845 [Candidatus Rhodobacter oscarellae]|uniref:Uncharacterized protein n=1 Tax=Candidatus Rhodobacter oscarellae TaxID=1675527 RepID=A0A0J9GTP6_9RHOB|nr:hypothetical protein AIOL_001845 [Candidatus Rhodobacter lobularis]